FSLATMHTTGDPFLVVPDGRKPSVADDGTLAYVALPSRPLQFAWLDRTGRIVDTLVTIGTALEDGGVFDLSPDGTRIATVRASTVDVWIYDLARNTNRRLTSNPGMDVNPHWTADGNHVVYQASPVRNAPATSWMA